MEFEVRGPAQVVGRVDQANFVLLHDPLLVTVLDFDRRALDQLAHGLHLAVSHTYNHAPGINKDGFFKHQGSPENPSHSEGGRDVYCLLKNIQENADTYSSLLKKDEEDIKETAEFLRDKIRNAMAHQTYLNCPGPDSNDASCSLNKTKTTEECLDKCAELLGWIVNAGFYQRIHKKVVIVYENIENMKEVFKDFKRVTQSMRDRKESCLDTEKAKDLLNNLLEELEEEEDYDETTEDRPITHLINMVLAPRVKVIRN